METNNFFKKKAKSLLNVALTGVLLAGNSEVAAKGTEPINYDSKNKKIETGVIQTGNPENVSQVLMTSKEDNTDKDKKEKKNESIDGPDSNTKKINISSFFETGTVKYVNENAEATAMDSIQTFIGSIEKKDLENFTIRILGTYSVDRPWGDISPEHPDGDKNTKIAQEREQMALALFKKAIIEKYGNDFFEKLSIESDSRGVSLLERFTQEEIDNMTPEEIEEEINKNQGMSLEIIKKIEKQVEQVGLSEAVKYYSNAYLIILDKSPSMAKDAKKVRTIIDTMNKDRSSDEEIKTVTLEGGNMEAHLNTLINVLDGLNESAFGKDIIVITDEPDENYDEAGYNQKIEEVMSKAKEKGVNIILKILNPYSAPNAASEVDVTIKLDQTTKDALKPMTKNQLRHMKYITKEDLRQAWYNNLIKSSNSSNSSELASK